MNSKKKIFVTTSIICFLAVIGFALKNYSDEQKIEQDLKDFQTRAHEREIKNEEERLKTSIEVEQAKRDLKQKEQEDLNKKVSEYRTALAAAKTYLAKPKTFSRKNIPFKGVTGKLYCRYVDGRIDYTLRFLGQPAVLEYVVDRMEQFELQSLNKQGDKIFSTTLDIKDFHPSKNKTGAIQSLDSGNLHWDADVGGYLSIERFQVRY